jgi:hypothetical protein
MINKTYLSRAQTRAMAFEHPVGDPTGGPAFGEKNDPITAVLSIATMAGTYAAAGTFAAMTLMQGITFAGAALSLIGNISGNKTLSKIGAIAGIAGGIGTFAESQGLFSSGTVGETFGMEGAKAGADAALSQTPTAAPEVVPDVAQVPPDAANVGVRSNAALDNTSLEPAPNVNTPGSATSPLNAPSSPISPPMGPVDYSLKPPGPAGFKAHIFWATWKCKTRVCGIFESRQFNGRRQRCWFRRYGHVEKQSNRRLRCCSSSGWSN